MTNQSFTTTFLVNQTPKKTFNCITNLRAWWSEQIEGRTDKLNEVFFYRYKDLHLCKIKLIEMIPNEKLVYQVLDNHFSFTKDKTEWTNTKLIFELSMDGDNTFVKFTHEGLVPEYECYNICLDSWGEYVKNSLYNLITNGKGQPNPIDNDEFDTEVVKKWKLK